MSSNNPKLCWEYLNEVSGKEVCTEKDRENCDACGNKTCDRDCWLIAPNQCTSKIGIDYCWNCPWFKENNPHFPKRFGK